MKDGLITAVVLLGLAALFWRVADGGPWSGTPTRPEGVEWCEPHDVALDRCEVCNPALARGGTQVVQLGEAGPDECPNTKLRINLGAGVAETVGLEVEELRTQDVDERLRVNAETSYLPGRMARIAPRATGVVQDVRVGLGDEVEEGAVLAVLDCPALARARAAVVKARADQGYWERLHAQRLELHPRITTQAELAEAEAELVRAQAEVASTGLELRALGFPADQDDDPVADGSLLELRASFAGTVVEMNAALGETVGPDRPLFGVADLSKLALTLDLAEADLARVEPGQKVTFFVQGLPGQRFPGSLVALAGAVDPSTRTVPAHAQIKNVRGLLRARLFGTAEVRMRPPEPRLLVPRAAVQNDGDCLLTFVAAADDVFLPRKIEVGAAYSGGFEVLAGLAPGERVATTGSFLLKTEILRGQIGAG